ncbi:MAG: nucleoside kinase [Oscillospiraceae bacterium]|jgi:uridine kinase|nr:nucleoside kinase [Oscillospiraceae bacterium]
MTNPTAIDINYINERALSDASAFVEECEDAYSATVSRTARTIADNLRDSSIVLLAGPSGSGKTTTAKRLDDDLTLLGINTHTISLDDYFLSPRLDSGPKTPNGAPDFESPECIDWTLLNAHFTALERGETVEIPHFSFSMQGRDPNKAKQLRLGRDEIAIFEGIHALSTRVTDVHPRAFRLFISAASDFTSDDRIVFQKEWTRLVRRAIRDSLFRGADALMTLGMWADVRRGEELYITPFKDSAHMQLNTTIPYEICAMRDLALDVFGKHTNAAAQLPDLLGILDALPSFAPIDATLVPPHSILREFFGGGKYEY